MLQFELNRFCRCKYKVILILGFFIMYDVLTLLSFYNEKTHRRTKLNISLTNAKYSSLNSRDKSVTHNIKTLQHTVSSFTYTITQPSLCLNIESAQNQNNGQKLINNEAKDNKEAQNPFLLFIAVISRMKNFKQRQIIRSTWGNSSLLRRLKVSLIFFI